MPPARARPASQRLAFHLIGHFRIETPDGPLSPTSVGARKARTLLKLLLVERGRVVSIDTIAEALWSSAPGNASRLVASLVSRLRGVLGRDAIEAHPDGYRFVPSPGREVDLDVAAHLVAQAEERLRTGSHALARSAAASAVDMLGAGDLLEDEPFAPWADEERSACERLRQRARTALWTAALAAGDHATALAAAEAATAADPVDEEAYRAAMLAYDRSGRRDRALLAYEQLRRNLADELGVAPSPETRAVHAAIVQERAGDSPRAPAARPAAGRAEMVGGLRFVGREPELELLQRTWADAVEGRGALLLVTGEAGVGKTALTGRLEAMARSTGGRVLSARCYEAERSLFLEPFADAIRPLVLASPTDVARDLTDDQAAALVELVPEADEALGSPRSLPASPEVERRRALEACVALLRGLSARHPVLLALDDLHNAGATTVELLHFAARRLASHRVVFVATIRSDEGDEALERLSRVATVVRVESLLEEAVTKLARDAGLPRLARRIFALSGGHPLYAVELIRSLAGAGNEHEARFPIPESLREAITSRARRAGEEVEEFLRAASVLGTVFDVTQAADLVGAPVDDAIRRADRARRASLVVPSDDQLGFANDLVREILYETTTPAIRVAWHRRAIPLTAHNPELAARHASAAGEAAEAASLWLEAAVRAARRFSNRDAEELLGRALAAAGNAGDAGLQARILVARGDVREALAAYESAHADHVAAVELTRAAVDPGMEVQALLRLGGDVAVGLGQASAVPIGHLEQGLALARRIGDTAGTVRILARLSILATNRLRSDLAEAYASEAVGVARGAGDDVLLAIALDARKTAHAYVGDLDRLSHVVAELEPILRRRDLLWLLQWAVFESAFPAFARGRWDNAVERIEEALRINERTGYSAYASFFTAHLAWTAAARGDGATATRIGRRAVALAERVGHTWWTAFANGIVGSLLVELGEIDDALPCLETGLAAAERDASAGYLARCLGPLALARWLTGDGDQALALAERAATILDDAIGSGGRVYLHAAHAQLAVARVWTASGQPQRARTLLADVVSAADAAGWVEFTAGAALRTAEADLAIGDRARAEANATQAHSVAQSAGLAVVEREAKALLAEVRAPRR